LFVRGDLAEYAALSIVPFVLWGYRALGRVDDEKVPWVGAATAVAHAAIWFCHTITGLYATEIVFVLLAITAGVNRKSRPALRRVLVAASTVGLGLAMASVYIIPAWLERSLVNLESIRTGAFHPTMNMALLPWLFSFGFFSIGLPTMVGAIVTALGLIRRQPRREGWALARWWLPAILLASLMLSWAAPFWNVWPLGSYIQFPWRLLGFVGVFSAVGVGVTLATLLPSGSRLRWPLCVALALSVVFVERSYNAAAFYDPQVVPSTPAIIRDGIKTSVVANEYLPLTVQSSPRRSRLQLAEVVAGAAQVNAVQLDALTYQIELDALGPCEIDVRVFDFPGWKVKTEVGPTGAQRSTTAAGLIRLTIPRPGHYRCRVHFGLTPLRACAAALTWLALLLAYPILRRIQRAKGSASPSLSAGADERR
jgi:hypothetical protein